MIRWMKTRLKSLHSKLRILFASPLYCLYFKSVPSLEFCHNVLPLSATSRLHTTKFSMYDIIFTLLLIQPSSCSHEIQHVQHNFLYHSCYNHRLLSDKFPRIELKELLYLLSAILLLPFTLIIYCSSSLLIPPVYAV